VQAGGDGLVAGGEHRDLPGLPGGGAAGMVVVAGLGALALLATAPICLWLIRALFGPARAVWPRR
jgi:hypothetical protein